MMEESGSHGAPLLGDGGSLQVAPKATPASRLWFYVGATLIVDLQAYLIGFTVSFSVRTSPSAATHT